MSTIRVGYRIGKLTVAEATDRRKNGYVVWKCCCDCGGEIFLDTRSLQRGAIRDCGCASVVGPGQRDVSGQKFGRLTAMRPTGERGAGGNMIWQCRCDCGKEICVDLNQLVSGNKKSCGCLKNPPLKDFVWQADGDGIRGQEEWYAPVEMRLRLRKGDAGRTDFVAERQDEKLRMLTGVSL